MLRIDQLLLSRSHYVYGQTLISSNEPNLRIGLKKTKKSHYSRCALIRTEPSMLTSSKMQEKLEFEMNAENSGSIKFALKRLVA